MKALLDITGYCIDTEDAPGLKRANTNTVYPPYPRECQTNMSGLKKGYVRPTQWTHTLSNRPRPESDDCLLLLLYSSVCVCVCERDRECVCVLWGNWTAERKCSCAAITPHWIPVTQLCTVEQNRLGPTGPFFFFFFSLSPLEENVFSNDTQTVHSPSVCSQVCGGKLLVRDALISNCVL